MRGSPIDWRAASVRLAASLANVFMWTSGRQVSISASLIAAAVVGLFCIALPLVAIFRSNVLLALNDAGGPVLRIFFQTCALFTIATLLNEVFGMLSWPIFRMLFPSALYSDHPAVTLALTMALFAFIIATSSRTRATDPVRSALLSLKIGLSVVIVALIRVRKGIPLVTPRERRRFGVPFGVPNVAGSGGALRATGIARHGRRGGNSGAEESNGRMENRVAWRVRRHCPWPDSGRTRGRRHCRFSLYGRKTNRRLGASSGSR